MKPFRSFLFIPGHREQMLEKGRTIAADALLPDLEDAVPPPEKPSARSMVRDYIPTLQGRPVFVRINAVGSGQARDDLRAVVVRGLTGVFIPKVESVGEVLEVSGWLDELEAAAGLPEPVAIVAMIESAIGVTRAFEIAKASERMGSICFGGAENGDLQTDLGCSWSIEGTELLYARSKVLLDARAAGIDYPLDGVYAGLDDPAGLAADCLLSQRLGYRGRLVIHPKHVEPANQAYSPQPEEVAYYRRLLSAFSAAKAEGKGAVSFEGKMVDFAMAARAERVTELADLIEATFS